MSEQQVYLPPSTPHRTWLVGVLCLLVLAAATVLVVTHRRYAGSEGGSSPETTVPPGQVEKLTAGLRAADSSRQLEAAVGLLQLGLTEGGLTLLELTTDADGSVRKAAAMEFGRVARPAAETVGVILDWPTGADTPPTVAQIASAKAFWERWVTPTLLRDVQVRLAGTDRQWAELSRMLAVRDRLYRISGKRSGDHTP